MGVFENVFLSTKNILNTKFIKKGGPFIVFILFGVVGLQQFASLRYEFAKPKWLTPEQVDALTVKMKKPGEVTLEAEFEKLKEIDIHNWENKRAPRPWEEENTN